MRSHDDQPAEPVRIDGRYHVDGELGQGGMARVYRVTDERSGQRLALKQLTGADERATLRVMFEREYHALVQLAHPRIIRVFDYGVAEAGPYYTMELLDGSDVRSLVRSKTLELKSICLLLRDVASALALIHSRRLLHRDVSPRNVWCTTDGRAKLIDFGTLVAMGPQTRCAGTPPFVPPEAAYQQPLDARCDLYALGALAYYMLTRRYAYPARDLAELHQRWQQRPKRPDAIRPELPRALCDLVMSLLSLDARGRPGSAAEVCERLTALCELPEEDEQHIAQAFLTSPKLVGRDQATSALRGRLLRARRSRGGAVAIVAPAGLGRSRMLQSFALEAKLMGATVIALDASAIGAEPFALGAALAERLLEAVPLAAASAVEVGPVLAHLSPAIARSFGAPQPAELKPFEHTRKLIGALLALLRAASRHARLVIAVDDVHRADGASLDLLARLSLVADEQRILLVTTCDEAALAAPAPALEQVTRAEPPLALPPLDAAQTHELLSSLFGAVPGLEEAADFLHELSQGSPQTCMQYAQYLVDEKLARYEGGHWRLPANLREQALPPTLDAMLESRLGTLSADARALLLGLLLSRDDTRAYWQPEQQVRLEDFPKLLEPGDGPTHPDELSRAADEAGRTFRALDDLLRVGLLEQRDSRYVIGQRATAEALLRSASEEERKRVHERLAQIFEGEAYIGRPLAIRQLQRAGMHERARARIAKLSAWVASSGGVYDWSTMRVSVSAECALTALEHWQANGGSALEGIRLRSMLLVTCSVYDWGIARLGDAQIEQLRADCGLVHWDATPPDLPPAERARECLRRAQEAYPQKSEMERGLPPEAALRELAASCMPLQGAFANTFDAASQRKLLDVLTPIRELSPELAVVAELCELGRDRVVGRELGERMLTVGVQKLLGQNALPELMRQGGAGIHIYIQAVADARRGKPRALELIGVFAPVVGDDMFLVVHGRWLAHAFAGRADAAAKLRKLAELVTEDDVWRRKAMLFVEAELFALTGDLLSLGRTCDAIAELAELFPGWRPWLSWARAELFRLRGEIDAAEAEVTAALALARPGEHRAYTSAAPLAAALQLLRGDPEGAIRTADAIASDVATHDLDRTVLVAAARVRALAESARGDHAAARSDMARAFALAAELEYGGLPLATLHEAAARIAIAACDVPACTAALTALHGLLEHADAPSLIHSYESLREESKQLAIEELPSVGGLAPSALASSTPLFTDVNVRLGGMDERSARAAQALALLVDDAGAIAGHLFLFDAGGLFAAAATDGGVASETLLAAAQRYVDFEVEATQVEAPTIADLGARPARRSPETTDDPAMSGVLIAHEAGKDLAITGVVLLRGHHVPPKQPRLELVRAISYSMLQAGDTLPRLV